MYVSGLVPLVLAVVMYSAVLQDDFRLEKAVCEDI